MGMSELGRGGGCTEGGSEGGEGGKREHEGSNGISAWSQLGPGGLSLGSDPGGGMETMVFGGVGVVASVRGKGGRRNQSERSDILLLWILGRRQSLGREVLTSQKLEKNFRMESRSGEGGPQEQGPLEEAAPAWEELTELLSPEREGQLWALDQIRSTLPRVLEQERRPGSSWSSPGKLGT